VVVVTFKSSTAWGGRTIAFDEAQRQFVLQEHGPISAQNLLD